MSLLSTIMSWPQFHNKSSLLSQIMRLDGAFMEYERLGSKLNDELKAAILLRSVTEQLKTWLQLQVSETTTYNNVREHILAYERSTAKWTEQMVLGNFLTHSLEDYALQMMTLQSQPHLQNCFHSLLELNLDRDSFRGDFLHQFRFCLDCVAPCLEFDKSSKA